MSNGAGEWGGVRGGDRGVSTGPYLQQGADFLQYLIHYGKGQSGYKLGPARLPIQIFQLVGKNNPADL